jgi:uncharacterized hydrophobic protein (TIGR00271 family)
VNTTTEEIKSTSRLNWNRLLGINRADRIRIYTSVFRSADLRDWNYWIELLLAAGIATLGLVLNSPAVIIGAMLISPLMAPIIAAGLALAAGDIYLAVRSAANLVLSIGGSIAFSAALVWALPFHAATPEILARTHPSLLDLAVAIFSGLAGTLLLLRGGGGGGVTALPGVAIAVSLMPPLCTVGFGAGAGMVAEIMSGAFLLFLTNLAAIIASAFFLFLAARMDAKGVREQIEAEIHRQAEGDRIFRLMGRLASAERLNHIGRLPFRIGLIAVTFVLLGRPLVQGFLQVKQETVARTTVARVLPRLVPPGALVSSDQNFSPDGISIRLVVTEDVPLQNIKDTEKEIARATGLDTSIQVRRVAQGDEVAQIRERLSRPVVLAPPPVLVRDIEEIRRDVTSRLDGATAGVWPEEAGELLAKELVLGEDGAVVRLHYRARQTLPDAAQSVLRNLIRVRMADPKLNVEFVRAAR